MTLDGFCDHTALIADDELHQAANELFQTADTVLFGRVTYQLMENSWPAIVKKPTGVKSIDEFARLIDNIYKVVFSRTLKQVEWKNTRLATDDLQEEVLKLKQKDGKNILVGSPSLIISLTKLGLIDEYRFLLQPIVLGSGLPLFKNINERIDLELLQTRTLGSGVIVLYFKPAKR